jgi:NADH-quinone oxidoreductase subunit J
VEAALFIVVALLATITALVVLVHRNPVIGALFLVGNLMCVAVLFLMLGAPFLSAIQVIVYAGAIMVLIVFVIMLLNLRRETGRALAAGVVPKVLGIAGAAGFVALVARAAWHLPEGVASLPPRFGSPELVGLALFARYFYPFEVVSVILLAAMAGAVVLAKRRL